MKTFIQYGYKACVLMFLYVFMFGMAIFIFELPKTQTDVYFDTELLNQMSEVPLRAAIIEKNNEALKTRLALIDEATHTIDISVYSIHNDESKDIIYYALLAAANRGVTIRLVIDGFFEGGLYYSDTAIDYLSMHENITIKYFNSFSLFSPQEVHNRMHDKILIVDAYYALMSGRNIGDRYFTGEGLFDRGVFIYGEDSTPVNDMTHYFTSLFNHPLSKTYVTKANETVASYLYDTYHDYIEIYPITDTLTTLKEKSLVIEQALFIHNPLTRTPKTPVVLETLVDIAAEYDDIIIQSPYVIITRDMDTILSPIMDKNITILTNSYGTNKNVLATSGYLRHRDTLSEQTTLYEYEGAMLHAKSMTFGDDISVIGSFNLDPRSAYFSTESMLVIVSEPFNQLLKTYMYTYIDDSTEITADHMSLDNASLRRRLILRLTSIVSYPFERLL